MIVNVPQELANEKFFQCERIEIEHSITEKWVSDVNPTLFAYDMLYWSGGQGFRPWQYGHMTIPDAFDKWKELAEACKVIFAARRKNEADLFMRQGIALFFQVVFWMNEQPVVLRNWHEHLNRLSIKPINVTERLSFVELRFTHYASFIQLTELFLEAKKLYYKTLAMKKRNE